MVMHQMKSVQAIFLLPLLLLFALPTALPVHASSSTLYSAIDAGATNLVSLQNSDGGWGWPLSGTSAPNTVGVTALGLLDAYRVTGNLSFLAHAKTSANCLVTDCLSSTHYAQDIEFLSQIGATTGNSTFINAASSFFTTQLKTDCPSAGCDANGLVTYYFNRYAPDAVWELASWVRAAQDTGNLAFANALSSAINALPFSDYSAYNANSYYFLELSGVVSVTHNSSAISHLLGSQSSNGGFNSTDIDQNEVQDTAYVVMALMSAGQTSAADRGATWLMNSQSMGAWMLDGEYTEVNSEAIQAMYSTYVRISPPPPPVPCHTDAVVYLTIINSTLQASGTFKPIVTYTDGVATVQVSSNTYWSPDVVGQVTITTITDFYFCPS